MNMWISASALVAGSLGLAGMAAAQELRAGSGASLPHPVAQMFETFGTQLAELSGGQMTVRQMGPEVAPLNNVIPNVQSGVLDIGNVVTQYFPAEFPNFTLLGELAVLGESAGAMTGAVTEYVMTCEPCLQEFTDKGLIYLGTASSTSYQLLTREPVETLEDLQGLRLRSGGAAYTRWAETMGAVPVELSFNEEFEAAASGLIDGSVAAPGNLMYGKLYEIVGHVTMMNIGTSHTGSQFTVRKETWAGLTPEQRGWVVEAAAAGLIGVIPLFEASDEEALGFATVHQPDETLTARHAEAQQAALAAAVEAGTTRYGLANPQADVERFAALVEKWNSIVAEIGDDPEALRQRMDEEIYARLDLASFGG